MASSPGTRNWHRAGMDPRWGNLHPKQEQPTMPSTAAITVIVTEAFLKRHPGSYFHVGDLVHIDARHCSYYVERDGQPKGGADEDGNPLEYGSCSPEWVEESLSFGGFVYTDDPLPEVPESGMYMSVTGKRRASLKLKHEGEWREGGVVELSIDGVFRKVRMDAVTARDMAYDLYRMARKMEKDEQ